MRKSILAVATLAIVSAGAQAAGFYLKEQSVVGQGRAFAGSAAGTDGASAAYFNPAGIVGLERQFEAGVHYIEPDVTVSQNADQTSLLAGSNTSVEPYNGKPVPNAQLVLPIDDTSAVGLSVGAPYGFSNDYGDSSFTRADNIKVDLSVIELSASYARALSERTNLSAGLVYQSLNVEQVVAASSTAGIQATQKADGTGLAAVFGITHKVSPQTQVGFSYRTKSDVDLTGTIATPASTTPITTVFKLPDIAAFGIAHEISDTTRIYGDATWYGWSTYDKTVAIHATAGVEVSSATNNYKNTISYAFGAEHDYSNGLTVRAGVHFDPTPTNDTDRSTTTPDSDRTWLSFGASKRIGNALTLDGALTHILADDGKINKANTLSGNPVLNVGADVKASTNILSLGLRYKF